MKLFIIRNALHLVEASHDFLQLYYSLQQKVEEAAVRSWVLISNLSFHILHLEMLKSPAVLLYGDDYQGLCFQVASFVHAERSRDKCKKSINKACMNLLSCVD